MTEWIICPCCDGEGKTVNPAIDGHGFLLDDPDFAEDYADGVYDITCRACGGSGKVKSVRLEEFRENAEEHRLAAIANGYLSDNNWRWG